jgi:hypothetical protein
MQVDLENERFEMAVDASASSTLRSRAAPLTYGAKFTPSYNIKTTPFSLETKDFKLDTILEDPQQRNHLQGVHLRLHFLGDLLALRVALSGRPRHCTSQGRKERLVLLREGLPTAPEVRPQSVRAHEGLDLGLGWGLDGLFGRRGRDRGDKESAQSW